MYFVTYSSVRQQVADEGSWIVVSLQERRSRHQIQRQECRVRQALEAARVADAQTAVMRKANSGCSRLQLLEVPQNNEQDPEHRPGLYGIGGGRERGKRPRIGISQVRPVLDHP